MPISTRRPVRRLSQEEFQEISYAAMRQAFEIHNDFGRFFDERVYQLELARRVPGVELEFPIDLTHGSFSTTLFVDAFIEGAPFELKVVESLTPRHRGQLYNYLLLLGLSHGKLVNFRPPSVEHEFVNATVTPADRFSFKSNFERWSSKVPGSDATQTCMMGLLNDWGSGLEIGLYESALTTLLGGEDSMIGSVDVLGDNIVLGQQSMRLAAEGVAFKITGLNSRLREFEAHTRRLLNHLDLRAILWINVTIEEATYVSLEK